MMPSAAARSVLPATLPYMTSMDISSDVAAALPIAAPVIVVHRVLQDPIARKNSPQPLSAAFARVFATGTTVRVATGLVANPTASQASVKPAMAI